MSGEREDTSVESGRRGGRGDTITGSRKQDGEVEPPPSSDSLFPSSYPILPQPRARTKHGTTAPFTPPTIDLLHKDGTIWA